MASRWESRFDSLAPSPELTSLISSAADAKVKTPRGRQAVNPGTHFILQRYVPAPGIGCSGFLHGVETFRQAGLNPLAIQRQSLAPQLVAVLVEIISDCLRVSVVQRHGHPPP